MRKVIVFLVIFLMTIVSVLAGQEGGDPVSLVTSIHYQEKEMPNNHLHQDAVPRGGTFDVVARINTNGQKFKKTVITLVQPRRRWEGAELQSVSVGGKEQKATEKVKLGSVEGKEEVRWRFKAPWQVRKVAGYYWFSIELTAKGRESVFGQVDIPQGVSCYTTTMKKRVDLLAKSEFCKVENIGKTQQGKDMYLLRVTDFSLPSDKKVKFFIMGPYHGREGTGVESCLDFAYELITLEKNKRYLEKCVVYIIPSTNPDGHDGFHRHPVNGVTMDDAFEKLEIPEAVNVVNVIEKYKDDLKGAIMSIHHNWGLDYTLIAGMGEKKEGKHTGQRDYHITRNMVLRVLENYSGRVELAYGSYDIKKRPGYIRGNMLHRFGIPNFVVENVATSRKYLAQEIEHINLELSINYATLESMLSSEAVNPKAAESRAVKIHKVKKAPICDGKLDDACWPESLDFAGFTSLVKYKPLWETSVHAVYDDKNIYLACKAPDFESSTIKGHDPDPGIWEQDGIELFFDTNFNRRSYFHFQLNTNGAIADNHFSYTLVADADTYNPEGITIGTSSKVIEVCIPFTALKDPDAVDPVPASPPPVGTVWGANFVRNAHAKKGGSSWSKLSIRSNHVPDQFNTMVFAGEEK